MEGIVLDCLHVLFLLYFLTPTYAYEKCTSGISQDECFVGKCCKINGVWECRLDGLEQCDSLAESDTSATQKPPSSNDSTDTASIAVPVGVAAGCLLILILVAIFAVYMRRLYREKRASSAYSYPSRTDTAINSPRNRLVDNSYHEQSSGEQKIPSYTNSYKQSKSNTNSPSGRSKSNYVTSPGDQNSSQSYNNSYKQSKNSPRNDLIDNAYNEQSSGEQNYSPSYKQSKSDNTRSSGRSRKKYETNQSTNERHTEYDSSTRSSNRENTNSQRNRPKSRQNLSYDNDNFQGDANQVPVWNTHQERSNDRARRSRPLRDYEEKRSRPLQQDNYDNDNMLVLEPYQPRPGRSRHREEPLPNERPPSYSEAMRQTEV